MIFMKDVTVGMIVYHTTRLLGTGEVRDTRMTEDNRRTPYKILVWFSFTGLQKWFRCSELQKSPKHIRSKEEIKAIGPFRKGK